MKTIHKKRIYFDFNVYDSIIKNRISIMPDFKRQYDVFISVAHIEEYYKAYKNDTYNKNKEFLGNLKESMLDVAKKGIILNPSESRVIAKPQMFSDCYDIIEKYDTRQVVEDNGEKLFYIENEKYSKLKDLDKSTINNTNLKKEEIWNRPEVIAELKKFPEYLKNYEKSDIYNLSSVYGLYNAHILHKRKNIAKEYKLQKDCFKKDYPNFGTIEMIIEFLNNILNECGYFRDKNVSKTQSGIHDVSHLIYSTYCNYLITLDANFKARAEAIYYYLGIDTKALSIEDFIKKENTILLNIKK